VKFQLDPTVGLRNDCCRKLGKLHILRQNPNLTFPGSYHLGCSSQYYRTNSRLIYSLPCNPLILETKGKGIHPCCFQVVVGFFCFLYCSHLMAQIRLYWTPLAYEYDVLGSPLDTLMDLLILTWLKHSMPLSMLLSWTESLDHLEHVMGPCWCV
jgi:hypothetical protein